jgi:hypothetical protein
LLPLQQVKVVVEEEENDAGRKDASPTFKTTVWAIATRASTARPSGGIFAKKRRGAFENGNS